MCGKSTNFHAKQKAALMSRFSVYTNVPGKRLPRHSIPRNDSKAGCHRERSVAISFAGLRALI
jgi:hypothetical protein